MNACIRLKVPSQLQLISGSMFPLSPSRPSHLSPESLDTIFTSQGVLGPEYSNPRATQEATAPKPQQYVSFSETALHQLPELN